MKSNIAFLIAAISLVLPASSQAVGDFEDEVPVLVATPAPGAPAPVCTPPLMADAAFQSPVAAQTQNSVRVVDGTICIVTSTYQGELDYQPYDLVFGIKNVRPPAMLEIREAYPI